MKKIKFSNGTDNSSNNHMASNDSTSINSTFEKQRRSSSKVGLSGFFGFLFSPAGIVLMFVAVNYPWLKTFFWGSSPTPTSAPTSSPTTGTTRVGYKTGSKRNPAGGGNVTLSGSSVDDIVNHISQSCKNPFRRIFDRHCRHEIKQLRLERKRAKMRKRRERQERRRRRQQELNSQSYANATVGVNLDSNDDYNVHNYIGRTTTLGTITAKTSSSSSSPQIKIVNMNTLECTNLLSRECRQKKRLMQQMKEALN